jgi:hypothetical protein
MSKNGVILRGIFILKGVFRRTAVMPHSKKTTVQQTNDRNMTERKANASAKSKEVQPNAQADPQLHHICFCPTAPQQSQTDTDI